MSARRCNVCSVTKSSTQFSTRHNACNVCRHEKNQPVPPIDAGMLQFGTTTERAVAEAFLAAGSISAAAIAMGLPTRTIRIHLTALARGAATRGHSPVNDMTRTVPDGFAVKGVSTLYGADGTVKQQWVKSRRDEETKYEALLEAFERSAEAFRGIADPKPAPAGPLSADLLNVIPMGDPHLGMYAWSAESGADFDLEIAERELYAAADRLVALAPEADQCLLINLGDFFHADNSSNMTARSHHALDVDTRWAKVLSVGVRVMQRIIDRALERHRLVTVRNEIGNHDDHSAIMLAICLREMYRREPRVHIDTSPAKFYYFRFGQCLLGTAHGDAAKPDKLPGVMSVDRAIDWGETLHRHWYTGHVHHESVKEFPGVVVETFRTLAPRDAWHARSGYRSGRDMRLDVWHREYGLINRHIVGIQWIQQNGRAA